MYCSSITLLLSSGVQSYPDFLFSERSEDIVEGSVIVLHCRVHNTAITMNITWTRNGTPLVPDLSHIRMTKSRSNDNSTLLMLTVNSFESSDNGIYQCIAEDMENISMGAVLMLTGTVVRTYAKIYSCRVFSLLQLHL